MLHMPHLFSNHANSSLHLRNDMHMCRHLHIKQMAHFCDHGILFPRDHFSVFYYITNCFFEVFSIFKTESL